MYMCVCTYIQCVYMYVYCVYVRVCRSASVLQRVARQCIVVGVLTIAYFSLCISRVNDIALQCQPNED